jgi:undecaprenyl-diphosphatase
LVRLLNTLFVSNNVMTVLVKILSVYAVYSIPVIWVVWWFVASKKERFLLLSSLVSGIIAWQGFNRVVKLFYERPRPIYDIDIRELLFERPDNSFPSDHAAFLSAIAFFFLLQKQKKAGLWLGLLAVLSSVARVAIAVHYPSDIIVGFLDGFIVAYAVNIFHVWLSKTVWEWCISLAKKLRLA